MFKMHFLQPSSLLPVLILICCLASTSVTAIERNQQYLNCAKPFQCGNLSIGYPFWGHNRPAYCGLPGFKIDCLNDTAPQITVMLEAYQVLSTDEASESITLVRTDMKNNVCPLRVVNTTLDFYLFNYTSDTRSLVLYYNCSSIPELSNSQFTCASNNTNSNYYVSNQFGSATFGDRLKACGGTIIVYAHQSNVQGLENGSMDLVSAVNGGFGLNWEVINRTKCDLCSLSGGQCGYNSSSNRFTCYCPDQPYESRCPPVIIKTGPVIWLNMNNGGVSTVFGLAMTGITYAVIASICKALCDCCRERKDNRTIEEFIRNQRSRGPRRYTYRQVKRITKSFKNKLGQGGYGAVYKGKLPDGRLVAVKVLRKSKNDGEEFINEVATISETSHVNVVTLLGFCYEKNRGALIYEFMPNGSLDKYIYDDRANGRLDWNTLYEIALGIARGLEYLHLGCNTRILHFDIKPHNILLDHNFHPKIADFGLAKLSATEDGTMSMFSARGTIGYIAPEVVCRIFGGVSHKSDVYSYGMMVLEMVGARKNFAARSMNASEEYFPDWVYKQIEPDENLRFGGIMNEDEERTVRRMIVISLWCIQTNPADRPSMSKVVEMLVGSLESLPLPQKSNVFSSNSSSNVFSSDPSSNIFSPDPSSQYSYSMNMESTSTLT